MGRNSAQGIFLFMVLEACQGKAAPRIPHSIQEIFIFAPDRFLQKTFLPFQAGNSRFETFSCKKTGEWRFDMFNPNLCLLFYTSFYDLGHYS
jgi:hypothetical protein